VHAALELVDRAGPTALTMRALARHLGVDPMAVYRHVRDKDDLLGAMCDAAVAELTPLDAAQPWEPQLRRLALELHAMLVRRPALLAVLSGAPATPVSLAAAHQAIGLLVAAGVSEDAAATTFAVVFSYVLGAAQVAAADPPPAADHPALLDGARALLGDADPPHLAAAAGLMQEPEDVERGLEFLLAGVRATLAGR
jgi:AcrR family transcriptional regulator